MEGRREKRLIGRVESDGLGLVSDASRVVVVMAFEGVETFWWRRRRDVNPSFTLGCLLCGFSGFFS
jgi:hypothetical protein